MVPDCVASAVIEWRYLTPPLGNQHTAPDSWLSAQPPVRPPSIPTFGTHSQAGSDGLGGGSEFAPNPIALRGAPGPPRPQFGESDRISGALGGTPPGPRLNRSEGGSGLDPPHPPPRLDPRPRQTSRNPARGAEFLRFFGACGAESWGGGGAPPTTLILLRNQCPWLVVAERNATRATAGIRGLPGLSRTSKIAKICLFQ